MKVNSLGELSNAITHAKQVRRRPKLSSDKSTIMGIYGYRDKQIVISASFDKNDQLCDIQPRRNPEVQSLFNEYKGRPYSLICDDLYEKFADMIREEII